MNCIAKHAIKGILFDKDGTLIDFNAAWIPAGMRAAERLAALAQAPQRYSELLQMAGYQPQTGLLKADSLWACGTSLELLEDWIRELGLAGGTALAEEILDFMTEVARENTRPVTELASLFADLRSRGLKLGVATMDLEAAAAAIMRGFGIREQLDFLCGCDSGHGHKPEPGMVRAFCASCGLDPGEVLVVGDTPHDLQMGRAAGAGAVVAVMSGVASRELLEPYADHVLDSVEGLRELPGL